MKFETTFKLGDDAADDPRFKAARQLAAQLSSVPCPWHNKTAEVQVAPGESAGDLRWSIKGACCDGLKQELAKLIDQAGG